MDVASDRHRILFLGILIVGRKKGRVGVYVKNKENKGGTI